MHLISLYQMVLRAYLWHHYEDTGGDWKLVHTQHAADLSARMARVQQRAAISLSSAAFGQGRRSTACMEAHAAPKLATTLGARDPSAQSNTL